MADNLTTTTTVSTIPSGTVIATDDAGAGGHVQLVKLAISTDGSATALTADNTNGLLVNLGTNNDVTVTGTVTVDTELPAAAAMADAAANPTVPGVAARTTVFNGTTWDRARSAGDNADAVATATLGRQLVNAKNQVFNGTTWDRMRGNTTGTYVHAATAHDAADAGNPVKIGGRAFNFDGTAPGTAVAENDRTNFIADVYGRQYVETAHPNYWHATANASTAQTDATVRAAPGAGLKLYITDVILTTDTAMNIELEHGTTDVIPPTYFAANGGMTTNFRTPIACAANTALTWTSSAAGNHSVLVVGYTAP